jgi:hypothetical protein
MIFSSIVYYSTEKRQKSSVFGGIKRWVGSKCDIKEYTSYTEQLDMNNRITTLPGK